jgi:replicative DNA helicase
MHRSDNTSRNARMDDYTPAIERHLLSICAWERDAYLQASATLNGTDFSDSRHTTIFAAIGTVATEPTRAHLDPFGVQVELLRVGRLDEAGGAAYLSEVVASVTHPRNLPGLISKVADESLRRHLSAEMAAHSAQVRVRTVPMDEIANRVRESAVRAATGAAPPADHTIGASLYALLDTFEHPESHPGLPTGIPELDELIGGLQPGQLITIAGATGSGKSSLASQMVTGAAHAASRNPGKFGAEPGRIAPVLLFTYEMSRLEVYTRLVAQSSPVQAPFRNGRGWLAEDKRWQAQNGSPASPSTSSTTPAPRSRT